MMDNKVAGGTGSRRGQVAMFVIFAIIIVAVIVIFFVIRGNIGVSGIDPEFAPIYNLYSDCLEQETKNALDILGSQGGRVEVGEVELGSSYAPFSSQLNFLGIPVPYWYYVSGNGIIRQAVPSKGDMEREIEVFLEERANDCVFDEYYSQGFYVELPNEVDANVDILDKEVRVNLRANVVALKDDRSARKTNHEIIVDSRIGEFFGLALDIYNKELEDAFLEDYAVDVLRLYAPVDGVEVSCGPEIWETGKVIEEIKEGLSANMASIKFEGDYYNLDEETDRYFVVEGVNVDSPVNLLYSKNWPAKIEIYGDRVSDELMIAEPIGNQQGLGALGFCYVPYHFVYDVSFPVMIQISDGFEIFQFPVAVIIDGNLAREAELLSIEQEEEFDLCRFNDGDIQVYTFDVNLNPVEADVSYRCFDSVCNLGTTELDGNNAFLNSKIPRCVNGQLVVEAEGFANKIQRYSSNEERIVDVILDREYEMVVDVEEFVGRGFAIVTFDKEDGGNVVSYLPDVDKVVLTEGQYEISVQVYGESNIVIPSSTKRQCVEVPRAGVLGLFGSKKEECFDITLPQTNIGNALIAGGKTNTYILDSELSSGKINLNTEVFPVPSSLEQVQFNNELFEGANLGVNFG